MPRVTNKRKPKRAMEVDRKPKHAKIEPEKLKEKKKTKKPKKIKSQKEKNTQETKDERFSFDNEIVIGLRRIDDEPKEESKKKKRKNNAKKDKQKRTNQKIKTNGKSKKQLKKQSNGQLENQDAIIISKYMQNYEETEESNEKVKLKRKSTNKNTKRNDIKSNKSKTNNQKTTNPKLTKKQQAQKKKRKRIVKIIKWLTLIGIIIAGIVYAMLSPIFNIKNIAVSGNAKVSSETIISLSGLSIDQNIFNFRTNNIKDNIQQNAYIDSVELHRNLPDEVQIIVKERVATFMLTLGNAYVYINNQGYILEITSIKGDFPLIVGYQTPEEQIQEGNRLDTDDLEKLNDVLKIMEAASSVGGNITNLVTQIDISDKANYILNLEKEKKKVYLGDTTNLSAKMLWINELLEAEKDNEGIIYLNIDLNTESPYFRKKV